MTREDYLAFERSSLNTKHEYFGGEKFAHYQGITTLQEYILVSQNKYLVEKFVRRDGKWEYYSYKGHDQTMPIESVDYKLPLSEIYWDINFEARQP